MPNQITLWIALGAIATILLISVIASVVRPRKAEEMAITSAIPSPEETGKNNPNGRKDDT